MARTAKSRFDRGTIELLEEAFHLVRGAGAATLSLYAVGTLPFALAALYFVADMSRSAFAAERLLTASAALAVTFVWMKCWHGAFLASLLRQVVGDSAGVAPEARRWTPRRIVRLVAAQTAVQPWGLLAVPLALIALVPLPWAYGFWQNACVLTAAREGADARLRPALREAWRLAAARPGQLGVAIGLLGVLGLILFINVSYAILLPAWLLKTLLNVETVFSRGGFDPLNSTFVTVTLALTFLLIDPIAKAFCVLRCFYGAGATTGQDLRAELHHLHSEQEPAEPATARPMRPGAAAALAALLVLLLAGNARAQDVAPPSPDGAGRVRPERLDESIEQVIRRREYAWRLPREERKESEVRSFLDSVLDRIGQGIDDFLEWLRGPEEEEDERPEEVEPEPVAGTDGGGSTWLSSVQYVVYALLGAAAIAMGILLWRTYRHRPPEPAVEAGAAGGAPDLEDESVGAEQLPAEGWLELAQRMMREGKGRLALRALFLASLALLAERELLRLARHKSNRDYQRELAAKAHALPDLVPAFNGNVRLFEDAWYGTHEVTQSILGRFAKNQRRIRAEAVEGPAA